MTPTELHALAAQCHQLGDSLASHANAHATASGTTVGALPPWFSTVTQILAIVQAILNGLNPTPAPAPAPTPAK